jgi:hypothetical protein
MTNGLESAKPRELICASCGAEFTCDPAGACWCMEESVRVPLPTEGRTSKYQDCLCRACLLRMAEAQSETAR